MDRGEQLICPRCGSLESEYMHAKVGDRCAHCPCKMVRRYVSIAKLGCGNAGARALAALKGETE